MIRENTIDSWNLSIDDALEFRREYGREAGWGKAESLYYQANPAQADNVGPNLLAGTGDSLLSTLLVPNPYYVLKALRMDVLDAVPVLESVLNTLIYSLGIKSEMELACLHAYLFGRGILKIGYDSEFGYEPAFDIGQAAGQVLGISLTQFDKKGSRIEFDSKVSPGMPWVKAVLPHDFLVPYGVTSLRTAPWCAHRIVRHIDDVKADPKYENTKDLVPSLSMSDYTKSYTTVMKPYRAGVTSNFDRRTGSDKVEFVEMWEIHDSRTGRVYVLSQGYDKFLRNEIDYLQEDGLPFVSLGFVPGARTFWTTPDALYLQPAQEEAQDIAAIQKRQRRIGLMKFIYEEGSIDNDELEKWFSSEIGVGVKAKQGSMQNGQLPIHAVTPSNNNDFLEREAENMRRNARETVGISRNQMGEYEAKGRRTASEAMIVQENADQRINRRSQALADSYCELGQKLAKIIFRFWQTPRVTEIIGPMGAAQWTTFTGAMLKGEYLYKIGFSNEPIETLQSRQQRAIGIFQSLSADPGIDQIALRRYLCRAFNDPEFNSIFLPGVTNNAALSSAMPGMLPQMGGVPPQGMQSGGTAPQPGGQMSQMPQQEGRAAVRRPKNVPQGVGPR